MEVEEATEKRAEGSSAYRANLEIISGEAPEGILRIDRESSGASGQDHAHFGGTPASGPQPEALDLPQLLQELDRLQSGEHFHMDEFVASPVPGSQHWLPVIESVTGALQDTGRSWTIVFPVGHTPEIFRPTGSLDELFEYADSEELLTPPYVVAVGTEFVPDRWEGEFAKVRTSIAPGVVEVVSVERSLLEEAWDDPFFVLVYREIVVASSAERD
jgi:hypothetical protein